MKPVKVYIASQIFAECWRDYNLRLYTRIKEEFPWLDIYLPQLNESINDKTKCAGGLEIATGDLTNNLDKDDIVIAVVDGDTPGIGTTVECGYFARRCQEEIERQGYTNKKIISLYTDSRECQHTVMPAKIDKLNEFAENQFSYINLLLVGVLKRYGVMCHTIEEVVEALREALQPYMEETNQYSLFNNSDYCRHQCLNYEACKQDYLSNQTNNCLRYNYIKQLGEEGKL